MVGSNNGWRQLPWQHLMMQFLAKCQPVPGNNRRITYLQCRCCVLPCFLSEVHRHNLPLHRHLFATSLPVFRDSLVLLLSNFPLLLLHRNIHRHLQKGPAMVATLVEVLSRGGSRKAVLKRYEWNSSDCSGCDRCYEAGNLGAGLLCSGSWPHACHRLCAELCDVIYKPVLTFWVGILFLVRMQRLAFAHCTVDCFHCKSWTRE